MEQGSCAATYSFLGLVYSLSQDAANPFLAGMEAQACQALAKVGAVLRASKVLASRIETGSLSNDQLPLFTKRFINSLELLTPGDAAVVPLQLKPQASAQNIAMREWERWRKENVKITGKTLRA